jgi:hypothetical protein
MCEYETLKPVKVISGRGMGERENNAGDESNWGTIYEYVEMSQ